MKVKFIDNVDISGKINISKGEIFEAREDGDFIMIRMKDDSTVKAPKSEIEGILEVVEGEQLKREALKARFHGNLRKEKYDVYTTNR